jgi:hypothetical protein
MTRITATTIVLTGLLGGAFAFADAAADKQKATELEGQAKKLREEAAHNRDAAEKNLVNAGNEEERADEEMNKANKLDREARGLLKEAAEDCEAAMLWHRAGWLYSVANGRALAARNHFQRAHRLGAAAKDIESASQKMAQASSAEPDAKEKARLQKESQALAGQAKFEEEEAKQVEAEGKHLEEMAQQDRKAAKELAEKAKQLDPKIAERHPTSHPAQHHDAKTASK